MGVLPQPDRVKDYVLNSCESLLDAIHICIQVGRLPHYAVAQRLGIDKGHFARMMTGQAHFPTNKIGQLMRICGNLAPLQFMAKEMGHEVFEDPMALELARIERRREEILSARGPSTFINQSQPLAA